MNKILIIDDDKELCELLQRSVLVENINADVCHSGKDGIFLLSTKQYQLIVLDITRATNSSTSNGFVR